MARISVEQKALTDPRFDLLGRFLQATRHDALGRMILVWNECQERNTYTLPERLVGAIMGDRDGARWVCESDLAVWVNKNEIRIRGTQGRIEWLEVKRTAARSNGRKGGRPPKNLNETNVGSSTVTAGNPDVTPPAPAPAPAIRENQSPASQVSGGKPRTAPTHIAIDYFCEHWKARFGKKYPFAAGKDATAVKSILGHLDGDLDAFRSVADRYLDDEDPFVAQSGHSVGLLLSQLPKWIVNHQPPPQRNGYQTHDDRIVGQLADAMNHAEEHHE